MTVYSEEGEYLPVGRGIYTDDLPSSIDEGFCVAADNFIANGKELESRAAFSRTSVTLQETALAPGFTKLITLSPSSVSDPAFIFTSGGPTIGIARYTDFGAGYSGNAYINPSVGTDYVRAGCQYGSRKYLATAGGVKYITAIDWTAGTITLSAAITAQSFNGLLIFKDRMWGWSGGVLYFTEVAAFGGFPETWALSTQNVNFNAPGGDTVIRQVLPVGSKLLVFTNRGLFSLHVEGSPSSWIKRTVDERSISTSHQTAFEYGGVGYYVNTLGVWATNGIGSPTKLSGPIEDSFEETSQYNETLHYINYLNDGMVVSVAFTNNGTVVPTGSKTFYAKIDELMWTTWSFNRPYNGSPNGILYLVQSVTPTIPTLIATGNKQYILFSTSLAAQTNITFNLASYEGIADDFYYFNGSIQTVTDRAIETYLRTRTTDGKAIHKEKNLKYAYMDVYNEGANKFNVSFYQDDNTNPTVTTVDVAQFNPETSNLVRVKGSTRYRQTSAAAAGLVNVGLHKIRGFILVKHTERNEPQQIR